MRSLTLILYVAGIQLGKLLSTYIQRFLTLGSHLRDKKVDLWIMVGDLPLPIWRLYRSLTQ